MVNFGGESLETAEIPNDNLGPIAAEVSEFDVLLTSIESCGRQLLDALQQLQNAPSPLLSELTKSYTSDSACADLLARMSIQLNACVYRLTSGMPHLEGLMELVQEVRPRVAAANDAVATRHDAWLAKVKADADSKALKGLPRDEQSARMKAKEAANAWFELTTLEAKRNVDTVLALRWPVTGTALTEFCHCYAGIFEAPPTLTNELYLSALKLTESVTQNCKEMPPGGPGFTSSRRSQTVGKEPRLSSKFSKGESVEVWSSSRQQWLQAIVQEIFNAPGSWDNYLVPAGVMRVESAVGMKFVKPEQASELLRKKQLSI